jgi:hypothetical protein
MNRWMFLAVFPITLLLAGCWRGEDDGDQMQRFNAPIDGADAAQVTLEIGVAEAEITPLTDSTDLFVAQVNYDAPVQFTITDGAQRQIRLADEGDEFFGSSDGDALWQVALNDSVPLDLTVNSGVGETRLELLGTLLTNLHIDADVGDVTVYLPATTHTVSVDGDVGEITLVLPLEAGVRLSAEVSVGELDVTDRLERISGESETTGESGVWQTDGFAEAAVQITIAVTADVGEITIR